MSYCVCTPTPDGEGIDIHPECAVHGRHVMPHETIGEDPWNLVVSDPHDQTECAEARRTLRDSRDLALRLVEELTGQRDRARDLAAHLEDENAHLLAKLVSHGITP